ncbi:acyl-CoA dehydrogenase [Actinoalloteichus sp. AHMU CJ021]|uniref:Methoxymalonate biosynthesis protein n=1 Tax=Actinoalloteichus caeruleus DSM 43889 TaxID=1120930 RepID=A0ABT1JDL5_ACTCY|nr:acyl-CoA dehydrogenase family protein [Actinoalloteichus caeruleus]AUS81172.1 acyl-CoA dehydrogenase [Actinoalloteichus sp. AHMU CJ021]MCP2330592.1 methoxymalonate biosynthesis protein [Actinoalloteichus caeruleus DSM 43889]
MPDALTSARDLVGTLVADRADAWDAAGRLPEDLLRDLGGRGLLCAEVPGSYGGLGAGSRDSGEFTAYVGSLCGSLRSIMTSQGMAAWTVRRLGDQDQRAAYLPRLTSGELAAVGFSEPDAGSDLSAMTTSVRVEDDVVVLDGEKMWVTGACYADLLVVFARSEDDVVVVVVPTATPGVTVERIPDPLGCRAAGHANVRFSSVRLPASAVLGGTGLSLLATTALAYGRISVAWGCVGILRACLNAAVTHARTREQFGKPLARHQLVARHLAELLVSEQVATRACEHASDLWDARSPDLVTAVVLAKHVAAGHAARGAATATQVLASAGAAHGHVVARAYRDAKLMEIIEGSTEICQLILAEHAVATVA